jgi:uncharacterized membrane protein (DUF485 family)
MLAAVLLAVASTIVFYIIEGHPILLAFLTRRAAPPVQKDMNLASLLAIGVFVVPPETLWRPTRVKVRRR